MKIDKAKTKAAILNMCLIGVALWLGFMAGYFEGTG